MTRTWWPDGAQLDRLARAALDGHRVLGVERLQGGFRNDNLLLRTDGGGYVLRRYPDGDRCAVEQALAARLRGQVPVAEVVYADPAGALLGEPVLVSRFVAGTQLDTVLAGRDRADLVQLAGGVGATLARIGAITFPEPGFFDGPDLRPHAIQDAELPAFVERCLATGNAGAVLSQAEIDAFRRLVASSAPCLRAVAGAASLVHSDFNGKNLLVARGGDGWRVTAVLDWEFAFAGSPLTDVGNMLRFRDELPPGFEGSFIEGFRAAGGHLPADWRRISRTLDLYALAEFLTRPPEHRFFGKAVERIRARLRDGDA